MARPPRVDLMATMLIGERVDLLDDRLVLRSGGRQRV
jgi:hypothetical protein